MGHWVILGFPDSSVGKESACNAGDPGSIPGSGRSPGEGIGYPLQYSWASLVAQLVNSTFNFWRTHQTSATSPFYTPTSQGSTRSNPVTFT